MSSFIRWKVDSALLLSEDYKLNNNIANKVHRMGFDYISKKYTHISPENIENFLKISKTLYKSLTGKGIDIGGGIGSVSSVVAKSNLVEEIICLEITENAVIKCQPIIKENILGLNSHKVISVIGDFNNLQLERESLDFAIAWDSIHHSFDPVETLKEIRRVLKKQGKFILIDRGHQNSTSDLEIERMLNVVYSKNFMIENFLPEDKVLSRRDNGEHEYRFNEWEEFFNQSGFIINEAFAVFGKGKNNKIKNDANYKEYSVAYELGGFEKQKIVYVLEK